MKKQILLIVAILTVSLGCDDQVETPNVSQETGVTVQPFEFDAHDVSNIKEISDGVYSVFSSSNPDYEGRLRQFTLDTNEPNPVWRLTQHWPVGVEQEDMAWHIEWMKKYDYDPESQVEHTELATVAPTLYDASTVYFHIYNNPGRAWASENGKEPAMFAALYKATATGEYPNQEWSMEPTPVYYSDNITWDRGGSRAVDAQVWQDNDGQQYMTIGSWDPAMRKVIHIVDMDESTGRIEGFNANEPAYYPEGGHPSFHPVGTFGEATYSFRHGGYYYLFVNLGGCCSGLTSTYEIVVGRSENIYGPYVDERGRDFMGKYNNESDEPQIEVFAGKGLISGLQGDTQYIGPGHTGIYETPRGKYCLSFHYYDGNANGTPRLGTREIVFDEEGWPYVVSDEEFAFWAN
ncbi:MAG: family 43 glycosylhydrolase [Bacteroidota bacterium]